MPLPRPGPGAGPVAQVALLGVLAATVGLGAAGWIVGVGCGLVTCLLLGRGLREHHAGGAREHRAGGAREHHAGGLGPADLVTLARAVLVGGVAALVADGFSRPVPVTALVALAAVALVLDAVDGAVARRTGTVSALGARFDMEVDAFLLLVLSVHLMPVIGGFVLAIGALRYAYGVAPRVLPWIEGPLPTRRWRKVVAAIQGVVLVVATAGVLPGPWAITLVGMALALLVESFGRDVAWRWRHRAADAQRHRPTAAQRATRRTVQEIRT